MTVLQANNICKTFGKGENEVLALNNINIQISNGDFVSIVGTSGSGKSTLLHILGGLDRPTSGEIIIDGTKIAELSDEELTIFRRRKIGFVFQSYNLIPTVDVYNNIVLPINLDGAKLDKPYIDEVIDILGLRNPSKLSGGQQQRVAIARALASKPAIILADEPTGNLDSKTSQDVIGLIKISSEKLKQTIVMITHDEKIAQLADRRLRIEDGVIVSGGADYVQGKK